MAKPKQILTDKEKSNIIALYEIGCIDSEVANVMHLPETTFKNIIKYNGLTDTIKKNKGIADRRVETSLYNQAISGNTVACIFWLCNRQPDKWHNVQRIEHTGKDGTQLNLTIDNLKKSVIDYEKESNQKSDK